MEGYSGNYTGPYWSDGKFQESVLFGTEDPKSELDYLSYLHDSAYAMYKDDAHRKAADEIYERDAKRLVGRFPHLAGDLVLYGNHAMRGAKGLAGDVSSGFKFGPLGAVIGAIKWQIGNMIDSHKMLKGTYLKKEKADVEALYARDPNFKDHPFASAYQPTSSRKVAVAPAPPNAGQTNGNSPPAKGSTLPAKGTEQGTAERNRKSQVAPAPPANENRSAELVSNQARRLNNYLALHAAARGSKQTPRKTKKKGNLRKAVKIDPYLHLR